MLEQSRGQISDKGYAKERVEREFQLPLQSPTLENQLASFQKIAPPLPPSLVRQFAREGFLKVEGVIDCRRINACARLLNHHLGYLQNSLCCAG